MRSLNRFFLIALAAALVAPASGSDEPVERWSVNTQSEKRELLASINFALSEVASSHAAGAGKIVRGTKEPFHVSSKSSSTLCASGVPVDPHRGHWIHVYVTRADHDTMVSGKGLYPEGTIILKQKFSDAAGTKTDLFTGMLKREKGYNAKAGDWEFFVLNAKATTVRATGRLESCIACHAPFKSTDFVSRSYLTAQGGAHE